MSFVEKYFLLISCLLVPILYIIVTAVFYILYKRELNKAHKIKAGAASRGQLRREGFYGCMALIIFSVTGYGIYFLYRSGLTQLYMDPLKSGWLYLPFSVMLMILFHDMYFYWTHRLLHLPFLFKKVHLIHHLSNDTSPFTSISFHPVESVIQAAVLPLIVLIIPVHPYALFVFLFYMVYKNVKGHAGYEFSTAASRERKRNRFHNYAIHHHLHHEKGKANYGLYFTIWDRLMKTFRNN